MTIFSFHSRDHKKRDRKEPARLEALPKLYVIGSKHHEQQDAQWALEVEDPWLRPNSADRTTAKSKDVGRQRSHESRSEAIDNQENGGGPSTETASHQAQSTEHEPLDTETTFFSFQSGSLGHRSSTPPCDRCVMKISIPLSPEYSTSRATDEAPSSLADQIEQRLQPNTTSTGSSQEYLQLALSILQQRPSPHQHILPTRAQGFDVDKFLYFATSTLAYRYSSFQRSSGSAEPSAESPRTIPEQYVSIEQIEACRGPEHAVQHIDYAKFLSENAELRRKMEEGTQSRFLNLDNYPELQAQYRRSYGNDVLNGQEHAESRNTKKKGFGGFWISYNNNNGQGQDDGCAEARAQRDPYGGLM